MYVLMRYMYIPGYLCKVHHHRSRKKSGVIAAYLTSLYLIIPYLSKISVLLLFICVVARTRYSFVCLPVSPVSPARPSDMHTVHGHKIVRLCLNGYMIIPNLVLVYVNAVSQSAQ